MVPFSTSTSAFWDGFRAFVPVMLGAAPFGLIYGVSAAESGNSFLETENQENYSAFVKSLEVMLNYYLETGEMIDEETLNKHQAAPSHE